MTPLPIYLIHWNQPAWVTSAAKTLLSSDIAVAVTVVDNGPPESTSALDLPPEVRLLPSGGNRGYAGGANMGLSDWIAGDAPWCVVGAHDLHVAPDTLRLLVAAGEADGSIGVLGPDVEMTGVGKLLASGEKVEIREWISGTCLLLRRTCIEDIGGFDERFKSYAEDRELGMRATRQGWKVARVMDAKAYGLGSVAADAGDRARANHVLLSYIIDGWPGVLRFFVRSVRNTLGHLRHAVHNPVTSRRDHLMRAARFPRTWSRAAVILATRRRPTSREPRRGSAMERRLRKRP